MKKVLLSACGRISQAWKRRVDVGFFGFTVRDGKTRVIISW